MNKETPENQPNKTLEQVKQEILEMVDNGVNYREIAKIPFKIDEAVRRFGISQISRWKKDRDEGVEENEGAAASKAFHLYEDGEGPVQAVVELKMFPEDAENYYKRWLEMKEQDLSTPSVPKRLKELEDQVGDVSSLIASQIKEIMEEDMTDYFPDSDDVWEFLISIKDLIKLKDIPIKDLYRNFKCPKCGSKHLMAVNVKCTKCDEESWWGYWPENN